MYSRLPLKFIGITDDFGMRKNPISGVSTFHYGLDLGWNKYQGEPVYAANSGKVVEEGFDSDLGNYLVLEYKEDGNTIINRYLHLKNRALVKKNKSVERGQIIGYMGNTGYSIATHLHFEYWICPKVYTYKYSDTAKYAKNPLKYCYLFNDQDVSASSLSKVKRVIGDPVKRNNNNNQIKIIEKYLNCRVLPSLNGKKLGYVELGYYNVLDSKKSDGYTWYKIDNNKWVAGVNNYLIKYLLSKKNNVIDDKNNAVLSNTNELDNYSYFIAPKDDYYFIKLKKDEKLYFPE